MIAELESKQLEAAILSQKIAHKNTDLTSLALSLEQQKKLPVKKKYPLMLLKWDGIGYEKNYNSEK